MKIARNHINQAEKTLNNISPSPYKEALENLLQFVLERSF